MTQQSLSRITGLLVMALAFGACQSSQENTAAVPPDTGSEFQEAPVSDPTPMPAKLAEFQTVYFDFDRFDIRDDARPALRGNADAVNGADGGAVTIEGHCDERGSAEYNLALGERRANAVKRYLVDLGVPSSKLRTVSFGEDRPAVQGHDESAWRYNRRADFVQ